MERKLVSVIIPTYNRKKQVLACIGSIMDSDYPSFEVIVVDNASGDGTAEAVEKAFPSVKVARLGHNAGAVAGRNEGIRHAKGEHLCFVDSDNLLRRDFLRQLVSAAERDPRAGFVGPKMYFRSDPGRIWYAGVEIDRRTSRTRYRGLNEIDTGRYDSEEEVHHIPNAWLVKREVIDAIGGMDPGYVMTYGEAEWAERARLAGFKVVFCPSAVAYHDVPLPGEKKGLRARIGFDSPYRVYYAARNRALYMRQFAKRSDYLAFILIYNNLFLLWYCGLLAAYGRFDLLKAYIRGYLSGVLNGRAFRKSPA
jgi:GT2 family glycosyltransferase